MSSPVDSSEPAISSKLIPSGEESVVSDPPCYDGREYLEVVEMPQSLLFASSARERGTMVIFNFDQSSHTSSLPHGSPVSSLSTHRLSQRIMPDTASVLTIASSSKKRKCRSLDTNASTRALVAESIFSNSESMEELT